MWTDGSTLRLAYNLARPPGSFPETQLAAVTSG
jgi:hypothetical protein